MSLRDNAIVAYAETKVMEKSDRDVFVLAGEMLEALLDKTGIDKNEIDGLVMAGLGRPRAAHPPLWPTPAHAAGGGARVRAAGADHARPAAGGPGGGARGGC